MSTLSNLVRGREELTWATVRRSMGEDDMAKKKSRLAVKPTKKPAAPKRQTAQPRRKRPKAPRTVEEVVAEALPTEIPAVVVVAAPEPQPGPSPEPPPVQDPDPESGT